MVRTSIQQYLCKKNESVQVDSQTSGGALNFFLDGVNQSATSFSFPMVTTPRQLSAVLTGPVGTQAGVRIRVVTNRPNSEDITVMVIGSGAHHAATKWDFSIGDDGVLSFAAGATAIESAAVKKPRKRARKPRQPRAPKGGN